MSDLVSQYWVGLSRHSVVPVAQGLHWALFSWALSLTQQPPPTPVSLLLSQLNFSINLLSGFLSRKCPQKSFVGLVKKIRKKRAAIVAYNQLFLHQLYFSAVLISSHMWPVNIYPVNKHHQDYICNGLVHSNKLKYIKCEKIQEKNVPHCLFLCESMCQTPSMCLQGLGLSCKVSPNKFSAQASQCESLPDHEVWLALGVMLHRPHYLSAGVNQLWPVLLKETQQLSCT